MKALAPLLLLPIVAALSFAEIPGTAYHRPIFSDDFASSEFGKRWGHYKSSSVVKDGVLVGITAETSDHNAVDHVKIDPERDLEVSVKFRFVSDQAKGFNVWFDDKNYKGSHAGHICSVTVYPKSVSIADAKTGNFRNDIYEKKKSPTGLSTEDKAYLQTKSKSFTLPAALSLKDWHSLVIRTQGDQVEASLDGKVVGSFTSEGITHDSKTLVSLTTNKIDVEYDDFSIKGVAKK
jgi:hypothetical protein